MVNHCPEQSECTDHWCEHVAPGEDIPAFVRYICHPHNLLFPPLTQADKDWARQIYESADHDGVAGTVAT